MTAEDPGDDRQEGRSGPPPRSVFVWAPLGSTAGTTRAEAVRPWLTYRLVMTGFTAVFGASAVLQPAATALGTVVTAVLGAAFGVVTLGLWTSRVWVERRYEVGFRRSGLDGYFVHRVCHERFWRRMCVDLATGERGEVPTAVHITAPAPYASRPSWWLDVRAADGRRLLRCRSFWVGSPARLFVVVAVIGSQDPRLVATPVPLPTIVRAGRFLPERVLPSNREWRPWRSRS